MSVLAQPQRRQMLSMPTATIGPKIWRERTVKLIQKNNKTVGRNEVSVQKHRMNDPLPSLRDTCAKSSNIVAFGYTREVRAVVVKLRSCLSNVNDEVKCLLTSKVALEKMMEHIRKDIELNKRSKADREFRPFMEQDHDMVDTLLSDERQILEKLKKDLEKQYKEVKDHLRGLANSRKRLAEVLEERSRVADLLCMAASSVDCDYYKRPATQSATERGMYTRRGTPCVNEDRTITSLDLVGAGGGEQDRNSRPNKMFSSTRQDDLTKVGVFLGRTSRGEERPVTPDIDPIGPMTPECTNAIEESENVVEYSRDIRRGVRDLIRYSDRTQKKAHAAVNHAFMGKIAESIELMQQLVLAEGENRLGFHRSLRYFMETDKVRGYNIGPVMYGDLRTHERLDRPIIRHYQRHPATNVPEAQDLINANYNLERALEHANSNLARLHSCDLKLKNDERNKKKAVSVDTEILRLRRQKADHRWMYGDL